MFDTKEKEFILTDLAKLPLVIPCSLSNTFVLNWHQNIPPDIPTSKMHCVTPPPDYMHWNNKTVGGELTI